MVLFELEPSNISDLNDADLRELVGRLCEAEAVTQGLATSKVNWGGAQEAPDGGLDVSVFDLGELSSPNFLQHPNTGFQVKTLDEPRELQEGNAREREGAPNHWRTREARRQLYHCQRQR